MKPFLHWVAAAASLLGLFFTLKPNLNEFSIGQVLVLVIIVLVFSAAALSDLKEWRRHSKKKYSTNEKISDYMYSMLKDSGACEICSRDASWISEMRIMRLLEQKAKDSELTFLVHQKTKSLKTLELLGAEVIEYGKLGFEPLTRFTIVNAGNKNSSYIAIGMQKPNHSHMIEEIDSSNSTFNIAVDLIRSIRVANDIYNKK